jgi:Zn ribbon nucleic-acid-binding protein
MAIGCSGSTPSGGGSGTAGTTGSGGTSGCTPDYACMPTAPNTGDYYADCVARVNQFRACVCLPPLARWNDGEACADMDAAYDPANGAHAGFIAGICSPEGNAQDECPAWQSSTMVVSQCLQQMYDEGPPPTNPCNGSCYQMHGHFINMTNTSYTMVACGIATVNGQVTAVQDFR